MSHVSTTLRSARHQLLPAATALVMLASSAAAFGEQRFTAVGGSQPGSIVLASFTRGDSDDLMVLDALAAAANAEQDGINVGSPVGRTETARATTYDPGFFSYSRAVAPLIAPPALSTADIASIEPMKGPAVGGYAEMLFRSPLRTR